MGAARDILHNYQHLIEDLTLIAGSKGVFDVKVDGDLIYSKHQTDRHAEPGEVLALFADLLPPDAKVYDRD